MKSEVYLFYLTLETRVLPAEAADTRSEHSVTKILSKLYFAEVISCKAHPTRAPGWFPRLDTR